MIHAVSRALSGTLRTLFNSLLRHNYFPQEWKIEKCLPIPKPKKSNHGDPKDYQPISLLSCLGKTFEKIQASRLAQEAEKNGEFTAQQMGSRQSLSAIDTLMVTLTKAQVWMDNPGKYSKVKGTNTTRPCIAMHDIEGAFNCVLHQTLKGLLIHFGFSETLINVLEECTRNKQYTWLLTTNKKTQQHSSQECRKASHCHQSYTWYTLAPSHHQHRTPTRDRNKLHWWRGTPAGSIKLRICDQETTRTHKPTPKPRSLP